MKVLKIGRDKSAEIKVKAPFYRKNSIWKHFFHVSLSKQSMVTNICRFRAALLALYEAHFIRIWSHWSYLFQCPTCTYMTGLSMLPDCRDFWKHLKNRKCRWFGIHPWWQSCFRFRRNPNRWKLCIFGSKNQNKTCLFHPNIDPRKMQK